ncbi:hypothetical protein SAMN05421857_2877 [Chryseobacterium formosense]|nr:hypothetical protein SAMN05421857_2877 [Chryseobacterium formosense]
MQVFSELRRSDTFIEKEVSKILSFIGDTHSRNYPKIVRKELYSLNSNQIQNAAYFTSLLSIIFYCFFLSE